ncbi:MAG: hypothetical protein HY000_20825 [Planctomycetes bacterium]|nr:hypothetical protein [Planctomycetota bacterium]
MRTTMLTEGLEDRAERIRRASCASLMCFTVSLASLGRAVADGMPASDKSPAVSLHPDNPRYLLFRGRPVVLVTGTEHYGAVFNRPFDYRAYLDDMAERKLNLTRTFVLFRELQASRNPYSTCKPESPDYIAPWPRSGPGLASDGEPKFDLDRWNDEFFQRLHDFLQQASRRGILVELTLLSCTYDETIWSLNPLHKANNLQGLGDVPAQDYISLRNRPLAEKQLALVRKVVRETAGYDNVYYETCNEPIGGFPGRATGEEVDRWQEAIGAAIREELATANRPHLVFGYPAAHLKPEIVLDSAFDGSLFDGVNHHAAISGPVTLRGQSFLLGRFMSCDMTLAALRDFHLAAGKLPKPCVNDEDNAASYRRDERGWTVTRKRAWTTVMSGGHYDVIDFSITVDRPTGTPASQRMLRSWLGFLWEFIHSLDFVHAKPMADWVSGPPEHVLACTLAVGDNDFASYLVDAREINSDPHAGEPWEGEVCLNLPAGTYRVGLFSPATGLTSPAVQVTAGSQPTRLFLPKFQHDIVIRATRMK